MAEPLKGNVLLVDDDPAVAKVLGFKAAEVAEIKNSGALSAPEKKEKAA